VTLFGILKLRKMNWKTLQNLEMIYFKIILTLYFFFRYTINFPFRVDVLQTLPSAVAVATNSFPARESFVAAVPWLGTSI